MFFSRTVNLFIVWGYFSIFSVVGINWSDVKDGADYLDHLEYQDLPAAGFLLFLAAGIVLYLIEKKFLRERTCRLCC